jgi:uncharacterized protein (DUF1499 family)
METQSPVKNKRSLIINISIIVIIIVWVLLRVILPNQTTFFAGQQPKNIGIISEQLAPCPNTPNCVSSFSQDLSHKIAPMPYNFTKKEALTKLETIINSQKRAKIIIQTDNYIYAQFTSFLMGYVDDVEFLLDDSKKIINVRSASRLGESDLGANRDRIEKISKEFL